MKKDSLKKVFSAIAVTAVAISATSVTAFADADPRNGFTDAEIENSSVKPVITATKETITLDAAKAEPGRTLTISVSNAAREYCSTGFHVYYDDRLTLNQDEWGDYEVTKVQTKLDIGTFEIDNVNAANFPAHSASVSNSSKTAGMKGFFVATAGKDNFGNDGDLWTFNVTLPSDVEAGDVFPIDIVYKSTESAEDVFLDIDRSNLLMQAYAFTKGIYNDENLNTVDEPIANTAYDGYILIEPEEITTTTTTTTEETTTTTTTTEATTTTTTTTVTTTSTTTSTSTSTATTTSTTTATGTDTTTSSVTGTGTATSTSTDTGTANTSSTTTAKTTTTGKGSSSSSSSKTSTSGSSNKTSGTSSTTNNPKTGVAGVGVAATGLAIAIGTAFILRKKED